MAPNFVNFQKLNLVEMVYYTTPVISSLFDANPKQIFCIFKKKKKKKKELELKFHMGAMVQALTVGGKTDAENI
jgi:hypothetical protein